MAYCVQRADLSRCCVFIKIVYCVQAAACLCCSAILKNETVYSSLNSMGKRAWLITHANNGVYLTFDMFVKLADFSSIDECHYTSDAAVTYTYLHFKQCIEQQAIAAFMAHARTEHGIMLFEICGYESISGTSADANMSEHVGFKVLLSHYQRNNDAFKSCTDGKPGVVRGLLWRSDSRARLRFIAGQRSKFLGKAFVEMENELEEYRQKAELVDFMRAQVADYERKIELYREKVQELGRFQFICHVLRSRVEDLNPKIQAYVFDVDHRGRPLFPDK